MGIFGFGKKHQETEAVPNTAPVAPITLSTVKDSGNEVQATGGLLNLNKNDMLNLTKATATLSRMRASAGWDVSTRFGSDYDLDIAAYMLDANGKLIRRGIVYYGHKNQEGINLDHDNLTGEGDGDDENMFFNFDKIPAEVATVAIYVVIYNANSRGQSFRHVKNAYVRMVDESVRPEREVCRYKLSEAGNDATAVHFADLNRTPDGWTFHAIGDYMNASIESIGHTY